MSCHPLPLLRLHSQCLNPQPQPHALVRSAYHFGSWLLHLGFLPEDLQLPRTLRRGNMGTGVWSLKVPFGPVLINQLGL